MKFINKEKILFLLLAVTAKAANAQLTIKNVVDDINSEFQLELNVFINLNNNNNSDSESYRNILRSTCKPLILYNNASAPVAPIYQQQTKNLLVIVWLNDVASMQDTFEFLDRLLWKLHWTQILFIVERKQAEKHSGLFQHCWSKGFTHVLVWTQGLLYSYQPYPKLQVVQLSSVEAYKSRNHLRNLQGKKVRVPLRQSSPHCFSYRDRQGDLKLTGYWYKLIEIFIQHFNGTTETDFISVEESKNQQDIMKLVKSRPFDFIPTDMHFSDHYASSDVFCLSKVLVICNMPSEIAKYKYLLKAFDLNIWLLCVSVFVLLWLLIAFKYQLLKRQWDIFGSCMQALTISNHQVSPHHCMLTYTLQVMPFLAGFLLGHFYNCNLSSMLTAKIYERPFTVLEDLLVTNKKLLESAVDIDHTLSLESVPDNIKQRLTTADSKHSFRSLVGNLSVAEYYYAVPDDLADFLLYQQKSFRRPLVQILKEPLYIRPYFIAMPHRSPHLSAFNRYLLYVQENGLYNKLQQDVKRDGIIGGELEFFVDKDIYQALNLSYFCGAFVLLGAGLLCALLVYILEMYFVSRKVK